MMKNIIKLYDSEIRANPVATPGLKVIRDASITRMEGAFNFVCSWKFSDKTAQEVTHNLAKDFRQRSEKLMWRVYEHDKPDNLEACLRQEGFIPEPRGTFMVLPLDRKIPEIISHDIRQVKTAKQLKGYLAVANAAFDEEASDNEISNHEVSNNKDTGEPDYFQSLLSEPDYALLSGYVDDEPVASGLLQIPSDTSFGLLFAGSVLPEYRRQGFYRALVAARAKIAREQGCQYLTTEAYDSSRPVLEKLGFIPVERETTWVLPIMK